MKRIWYKSPRTRPKNEQYFENKKDALKKYGIKDRPESYCDYEALAAISEAMGYKIIHGTYDYYIMPLPIMEVDSEEHRRFLSLCEEHNVQLLERPLHNRGEYTMTRDDLVNEIAARAGISSEQANTALDALKEITYREARNGFVIPGIGWVSVGRTKARTANLPGRPSITASLMSAEILNTSSSMASISKSR